MNWDGLRYFLAAAEAGSMTGAAKTLNSNQPTVGRHIDALELALGIKLFQRSVKGLTLTNEGQHIYEQSQHIYNTIVKINRSIEGDKEVISGNVRLSMPEGLSIEVLTPMLNDFYQLYPHIKLIINVSHTTANITQGEADIAVRLFRPEESDLVVKCLGEMKMGLFASRIYKECHGLPSTIKDLKHHKIISYDDELSILPENQWLLEHSDKSNNVLSSNSTINRLRATISGVGISVQPVILQQSNPELLQIFKNTPIPSHKVWLVYHKDIKHIMRIRAVVDFISTSLLRKLN